MPLYELRHTVQRNLYFFVSGRIRHSHEADPRCAEAAAWDDGDVFFLEQAFGKFVIIHASASDAWKGVERALRFRAGQADLVQPTHNQLAAAIIFGAHFLEIRLADFQCLQCRPLRHGWRGHDEGS